MRPFDDPDLRKIFDSLDPNVRSWAMVGYYLRCFAWMEGAMVEVLRRALRARPTEIEFVARWVDASSKINALRALIEHCIYAEEKATKYKGILNRAEKTLRERNLIAHSFFGPEQNGDGIFLREVRSTNGAKISAVILSAEAIIEKSRALLALKLEIEQMQGFETADKVFIRRLDVDLDI